MQQEALISNSIPKKDTGGRQGSTHVYSANAENAQLNLNTLPSGGPNLGIAGSKRYGHKDHTADSCRQTQYRALYLRAREDYEKLRGAYLRLKNFHAAFKDAQERYDEDRMDELDSCKHEVPQGAANEDMTTLEHARHAEMGQTSSSDFVPGSSARSLINIPESCSLLLPKLRKEDQAVDGSTRIEDVARQKINNVRDPFKAFPEGSVRNLTALHDPLRTEYPSASSSIRQTALADSEASQGGKTLSGVDPGIILDARLEVNQIATEDTKASRDTRTSSDFDPSGEDSDEPIIISERLVKRRRPYIKTNAVPNVLEDGYAVNRGLTKSVRIKSDHGSSSSVPNVPNPTVANHHDSIDLDDVGDRTLTPRKRRRMWAAMRSTSSEAQLLSSEPDDGRLLGSKLNHIADQNRWMSRQMTPGGKLGQPSRNESPGTPNSEWVATGAAFFRDYDNENATEGSKTVRQSTPFREGAGVHQQLESLSSNTPPRSPHFETESRTEPNASATAAQEPLRRRPLSKLCPEDFRLNPQHKLGLAYAYSEVIRKRDARRCMNGCTRPNCCGALLRKAIEIGGYMAPRISRHTEAEEEDQRLLDEYLGDDKHRLTGMPVHEKKELLLRAQTERFANQYGKHRHAYGRGSTPPGFWNTDMPTTQEEMENRKAAQAMEREKVEDMYREAMRPDGRYKFRNERDR